MNDDVNVHSNPHVVEHLKCEIEFKGGRVCVKHPSLDFSFYYLPYAYWSFNNEYMSAEVKSAHSAWLNEISSELGFEVEFTEMMDQDHDVARLTKKDRAEGDGWY